MIFEQKLEKGHLLKRYKRFLADVETEQGQMLTIHCPNTGSMRNCLCEGAPLWFSTSANAKRKYPHTWEIATTPTGDLAGINTGRANALVEEALLAGRLPEIGGIEEIQREVRYGQERSRIDLLINEQHFIEVKNVTLCEGQGRGFFPDAISTRGAKHLRELTHLVRSGSSASLIYCVQHSGIESVAPAHHIDPDYSRAFIEAVDAGVGVYALKAKLSEREIILERAIPVLREQGEFAHQ